MSGAKNLKALTSCRSINEIAALHLLLGTINTVSCLWIAQPPTRTSHFNPASLLSPLNPHTTDIDGCSIQYGARRRDCSVLQTRGSNRARSLSELGQTCDEGQMTEGCLDRAARSNWTRVRKFFPTCVFNGCLKCPWWVCLSPETTQAV